MNTFDSVLDKLGLVKKAKIKYPEWALQTADVERFAMPDLSLYHNQAELYQRLSWVSTAVEMTAQTGALATFSVFELEGEEKKEIINHPFELLLQKPNPVDSRFEFLRASYAARKLTGNCYWWLNKIMEKEPPSEIWFIPPDRITPVPDKNLYLKGYSYDPGGGQLIALLPDEIVHFRRYNPNNRFVGLSAIESLAVVAIGDMKMQDWNTRLFGQNNARLPGVLSFADMIPDAEWKRMLEEAEDKAAKRQIMMLRGVGTGAVTYQNIAANPKDMEFLAGRTMNKEEIWSVLAPGLVSMLDKNATEANSKTGERTFREHTVYPLIVEIAEKINTELLPYWGDNLKGEFEDIRITDRQLELAEIETYSKTHTIDEIRQEHYGDKPIGDERGKLLIVEISKPAFGEQPAPEGGKPGELPEPKPEEKPAEKSDSGYKDALKLWRRRALRKQHETDIGLFDHEAIDPATNAAIKARLEDILKLKTRQKRLEAINSLFDEYQDTPVMKTEPQASEIDKLMLMVQTGIEALKSIDVLPEATVEETTETSEEIKE
jgi:HK97 family phage portal protein